MAEEKKGKDNKSKTPITNMGGEMGLGTIMLLILIAVFIMWVLTGMKRTNSTNDLFVNTSVQQAIPTRNYVPSN